MKDEVYYFHQTPELLAKELIKFVPLEPNDKVLEPFKGEGAFYNNLPDNIKKDFCEIEEGKDYKEYNNEIDWIISNPPFCFDYKPDGKKRENAYFKTLSHFSTKVNKGIAYLSNDRCFSSLTPKRMKELNDNGLYIHKIIVCSVKKWRGRYYFIIFKKQENKFIDFLNGNF